MLVLSAHSIADVMNELAKEDAPRFTTISYVDCIRISLQNGALLPFNRCRRNPPWTLLATTVLIKDATAQMPRGASFVIKYFFLPCLSVSQTTPETSMPLSNVYSDQTSSIAIAYDRVPRATSMLDSQETASNDTATVLSAHLLFSNTPLATSIAGFILERHQFLAVPPHLA